MVGRYLELEVGTSEEVTHIVNHVGILVDLNGVQVEFHTTIGSALLTEEHRELIVDLYTDSCHVDG